MNQEKNEDIIEHDRFLLLLPEDTQNDGRERKIEPIFCSDTSDDWQENANLDWSSDIDLYATGYKKAAEKLIETVLNKPIDQDILIYPIVFLYRQYVELRIKEIIIEGRILLEEGNDFPKHHNIWNLWCTAKQISIKVFENEIEHPDFSYVEHVIKEFSQIDPDSFSFRYPTDKQGDKTLEGITHINIRRVAQHIKGLSKELDSISLGISVYREWQLEMNLSC